MYFKAMRDFFKPLSLVFFLLLVSASFAEKENKPDFAPPYDSDANIVQKEIEDWIAREKARASKKDAFVVLKTDVLGRHLSSGTIELLKKSREVSPSGQKRLVVISDMQTSDDPIEEINGRYEHDAVTGSRKYYLNGQEINEKDYLSQREKSWERFGKRKKGKRNLRIPGEIGSDAVTWTAWMTAEEISELLEKNKKLIISDYVEPQDAALQPTILNLTQLSTHAFCNNYKGRQIGIYFFETGCPEVYSSGVNTSNYVQMDYCPAVSGHGTAVTRILQMASPEAKIYGYYQNAYPPNPFSKSPPIEIGSRSQQYDTQTYDSKDFDMDQYIYENRVIQFVAAGNRGDSHTYVTSPGKAVNAITVGAVKPEDGYYACYSGWRNSDVLNEKPEVAAYTNIDFSDVDYLVSSFPNDKPICGKYYPAGNFDGTSAATPLLAGFTASLLEQHPFFKRHPALVKALYLTGSTEPINGSHDLDNSKSAKALIPYSSVAWNTRSWYCEGGNSACFDKNNNTERYITENNIQANKRYRIAIAWLSHAGYVYNNNNRRLPQDIDLYVYQNGIEIEHSASSYNPFELVDFVTTSSAPITIKILRYRNSAIDNNGQKDNVILGYNFWVRN